MGSCLYQVCLRREHGCLEGSCPTLLLTFSSSHVPSARTAILQQISTPAPQQPEALSGKNSLRVFPRLCPASAAPERTSVGLLVHASSGKLWLSVDSHTATYQGPVVTGKKASCGHKEPREVDQAPGHRLHGDPADCAEEPDPLRGPGWDRGGSRQGPPGPFGAMDCRSQPTVYLQT